MAYPSTTDSAFRNTVAQWASSREVLALIRFSAAAGSKSFEFFGSIDKFLSRLSELPPQACVTVFGGRQLPLRGVVDEGFVHQALAEIPEGTEFLVVDLELVGAGGVECYRHVSGETTQELLESLEDLRGRSVAAGAYPPWLEDGADVISAVVPNADGTVATGIY